MWAVPAAYRGMIEILKANENGAGVTHVLVMDDDIVLDTDVLLRTCTLLSLRQAGICGCICRWCYAAAGPP